MFCYKVTFCWVFFVEFNATIYDSYTNSIMKVYRLRPFLSTVLSKATWNSITPRKVPPPMDLNFSAHTHRSLIYTWQILRRRRQRHTGGVQDLIGKPAGQGWNSIDHRHNQVRDVDRESLGRDSTLSWLLLLLLLLAEIAACRDEISNIFIMSPARCSPGSTRLSTTRLTSRDLTRDECSTRTTEGTQ